MKMYLESLGCARNLVDSEVMLGRLKQAGWTVTENPAEADTIIVNTCSFIEPAVNESIDTILELAKFKENGICRRLIVVGCLPERFREEIGPALPEVDVFLGTGAFDKIVEAVQGSLHMAASQSRCLLPDPDLIMPQDRGIARERSDVHTAYLKIAEGCSRHCTYCIIPKLRGRQKSRPLGDIVAEARSLIASNTKELILVAQDTTSYGEDLEPAVRLDRLLIRLSELSPDVWLRLLYGHPESLDDGVIKTVGDCANICSSFDIPIQHASDPVLKRMGRHYSMDDLYRLFERVRSLAPGAALRTTVIVGFPGETEHDFAQLLNFVADVRFDHLGVFVYSDSKDLPSHRLGDHVSASTAKERYDGLMSRQLEISRENNRKHIGRVLKVLVEDTPEEKLYTGRTFFQAPDVDGITYIHSEQLPIGGFARVKITDALEYDLIGEAV